MGKLQTVVRLIDGLPILALLETFSTVVAVYVFYILLNLAHKTNRNLRKIFRILLFHLS